MLKLPEFEEFTITNENSEPQEFHLLRIKNSNTPILVDSRNHRMDVPAEPDRMYHVALKNPLIINDNTLTLDKVKEMFGDKYLTRNIEIFLDNATSSGTLRVDGGYEFKSFEEAYVDVDGDLSQLYMDTEVFCDDPIIVGLVKSMGYDGIIAKVHTWGHDDVTEARPFYPHQARSIETGKELEFTKQKSQEATNSL